MITKLDFVAVPSRDAQRAHRFYVDARHELFNETNRDEVTRDLIAWLDGIGCAKREEAPA